MTSEQVRERAPRPMTNAAFGAMLGVTESYASYLRTGTRRPSAALILHMIKTWALSPEESYMLLMAYDAGTAEFAAYLGTLFPRVSEDRQ